MTEDGKKVFPFYGHPFLPLSVMSSVTSFLREKGETEA